MALVFDYWWMFLITITGVAAVIVTAGYIFKRKYYETDAKKYLANTSRLTLTKQYKAMMSMYKVGLASTLTLMIVATILLVGVSAKPVEVVTSEPIKYNRDIVLCLDVSGSMTYVDIEIMDKFKHLIKEFAGERISLVVFNSVANQVFPLTDDYNYMEEQFDKVIKGINGDVAAYDVFAYTLRGDGASLVGDGLTACLQSFDSNNDTEVRSRSIIYATDNMVNGEEIVPLDQAIDLAIRDKVKVYGINPELEGYMEAQAMRQEIERTGGEYYVLKNNSLVPSIVDKISAEQTNATKASPIVIKTDVPNGLIIFSGLAIIISLALGWRFKI